MADIGVQVAYATVSEASAYLIGKTAWTAAAFQTKTDGLLEARYYIDSQYSCPSFDQSDPPDEIKFASSLLAYDFVLAGDIFYVNQSGIKKKRVKAGSVEVETEYIGANKIKPTTKGQVDAILASLGCSVNAGTVFLQRA